MKATKEDIQYLQPVVDEIMGEMDRINDIFDYFHATPYFLFEVESNPYGGNPELIVTFRYDTKMFPGKTVKFVYRPAFTTVQNFVNEIKSYMFDCVDAFVSLLF